MIIGDLVEYLEGLPVDSRLSVLVINNKKRERYRVDSFGAITDMEFPVFYLEIQEGEPLDETYGQMNLLEVIENNVELEKGREP